MIAQLDKLYIKNNFSKVPQRIFSYLFFEGRPLTTKGQWINPIVFGHFAIEKKIFRLRGIKSPVYIAGTGRSGTTILGVVLSVHRQIGFLNEPKAMWHSFCPFEDVIGSYSRRDALYRLGAQQVTGKIKRDAYRLYGAYSFLVRRERVVDKYPEVIFRIPFVREIFPDSKFIFLTRNGWDACASINSWSKLKGQTKKGEVHDWWGADRRKWEMMKDQLIKTAPDLAPIHGIIDDIDDHRIMAAVEWVVTMREGLRACSIYPGIMMLRYEDLVAFPKAKLRDVFSFSNLAEDSDCLRYAEQVLKPVSPYPPFDMPAPLRVIFDDTMSLLGYC